MFFSDNLCTEIYQVRNFRLSGANQLALPTLTPRVNSDPCALYIQDYTHRLTGAQTDW